MIQPYLQRQLELLQRQLAQHMQQPLLALTPAAYCLAARAQVLQQVLHWRNQGLSWHSVHARTKRYEPHYGSQLDNYVSGQLRHAWAWAVSMTEIRIVPKRIPMRAGCWRNTFTMYVPGQPAMENPDVRKLLHRARQWDMPIKEEAECKS